VSEAVVEGAAGGAAGVVSLAATFPMLTLATRRQVRMAKGGGVDGVDRDDMDDKADGMKSTGDTSIWARIGYLYTGLGMASVGQVVSFGVYYLASAVVRGWVMGREAARPGMGLGAVGPVRALGIAAAAGCVNVVVTNPIWVVVTRMQVDAGRQEGEARGGAVVAVRRIISENGVVGLWRGIGPSLAMVSNPALQMLAQEGVLGLLWRASGGDARRDRSSRWNVFLAGAVGKLFSTLATYPFLVAKSVQQAGSGRETRSSLRILMDLIERRGFIGLYDGLGLKVVQSVLASAILVTTQREFSLSLARLGAKAAAARRRRLPSKHTAVIK